MGACEWHELEKAMTPQAAAAAIVRAASSGKPVTVIDRPHMRFVFGLLGGPRGLGRAIVHSAYKPVLRFRDARGPSSP